MRVGLWMVALVTLGACTGGGGGDDFDVCEEGGEAYLRTTLSGGLDEELDWVAGGTGNRSLGCGSAGLGSGLQVAYIGEASDGTQLLVDFFLDGLAEGQTGEVTGSIRIGAEVENGLFQSEESGCTFDVSRNDFLGSDAVADGYLIEASGTCPDITDLFGGNPVSLTPISFLGIGVYPMWEAE